MLNKCLNLFRKYEEIIIYLIMGVLSTIVNIGVKYLLLFTILDASNAFDLQISILVSWVAAVLFAYFTNRKFVFKSKSTQIFKEFLNFIMARIATLVLEMFIMWFFITLLKMNSNLFVIIWTFISQLLVIIFNYIFSKMFIFKINYK